MEESNRNFHECVKYQEKTGTGTYLNAHKNSKGCCAWTSHFPLKSRGIVKDDEEYCGLPLSTITP